MKKIIVFLFLLCFVTTASFAQKLSAKKVPAAITAAFAKNHASITKVSWEMEKTNYEAGFMLNGKETSEVYTAQGVLVETEVAINVAELPEAVKMKLKGKKVAEAAKITKADGTVVYEAEVGGKDLLFDAKGNMIKS
ncbi:PepSY-like domain-containing protein [Pedobacter sp. Hv1]|uniref:PepSY-like domain-containing protein n=1 Tax=Pedobacter sp. Hv1 TaxID=1740090 RepID=UPI0006D8B9A9|nr:PepSY-like domain-containing protein [Pedobacter sp. Hv1]KQC00026.1 hypothetical protein AQF98_16090 [Pedobacter sp. Hv1]